MGSERGFMRRGLWGVGGLIMGLCSDYVYGAVASVDTAEFVEYAAAACVVGGR